MSEQSAEVVTVDIALANAARLLHDAEAEPDVPTIERLERIAGIWISIAAVLVQREGGMGV